MTRSLAVVAAVLALAGLPAVVDARPGQATRPTGDAALMPADGAAPGWKKTEPVRVFTRADLYGYIDGGAELFLEMGFDQLTLQKYRNGTTEFAVEIYRMTDPAAATGIYLMKCGKETRDPAFRARHTINRHELMFVRERYYVTINNLSGADRLSSELVRFGDLVSRALPADRVPADLTRLPATGLVPGSERLVRGPFSLQAIYTLGDGDILQLGGKIVGVAGTYKDAAGTTAVVLVAYPDAAAASKAFANVRQNLDKYLKPVTATPAKLVFKDYENKFGVMTVTGRQVELRLHLAAVPQ
jgi:Family of unknown function (DUF6599)